MSLVVALPWSSRPWALPIMTVLAPSKQYNEERNRPHKTVIDWTITLVRLLSRWLGKDRSWILLGDGAFACLRFARTCVNKGGALIARFRLDSCIYEMPPSPVPGQRGRRAVKGARVRLDNLAQDPSQAWKEVSVRWYANEERPVEILTGVHLWYKSGEAPVKIRWVIVKDPEGIKRTEAFFSTDVSLEAEKIVEFYVQRWGTEVTFSEVRAHLGVETQRQWSEKAITRTTPVLMGLYSLVCMMALELRKTDLFSPRSTAWYVKGDEATFSDVLAFVRRAIWASPYFNKSRVEGRFVKILSQSWENILDQLADTG